MASTSFPETAQDWRGRFIANLAAGLARRADIKLSLWAPPGDLPPHVTSIATPDDRNWLQNMSQQGGIAHLLRNNKMRAAATASALLTRLRNVYRHSQADVAHINWLQNSLPLWGTRTPAVISVLGSDFGLLRVPGMKSLLRSVFKQRRTILTPNAEWMYEHLAHAFGDVAEIYPVPFGIDEAWFSLRRRPFESDVCHWLAVTRLTKNKIGELFDWSEGLFGPKRVLHLFGPMQEQIALPAWIKYHGPTHPSDLLTNWFPMASGLITLSRHDEGRPQVMLEAMAAGLPVIASDLPAHRDIITHKKTGWLAESRNHFDLALKQMEEPSQNHLIGEAARTYVKHDMGTWDDCAARYARLYAKLLEAQN